MKRIEDLCFTDGFMFAEVMHNPEICRKVIELLLHIKISRIEYPELEKTIQPFYTQKGVRFDVYTEGDNKCFDVEIQNYNEKNLGKRCRYYQSMLDADQLSKGAEYSSLKESYIIFLCAQDPFGFELPCYTFRTICEENPDVDFADKTKKVIYNFGRFSEIEEPEIQAFLEYLKNRNTRSEITMEIERDVEYTKTKLSFINAYMAYALHDRDVKLEGFNEGKEAGQAQAKLEAAVIAVTKLGAKAETVSELYNVPLSDLQQALSANFEALDEAAEK